MKQKYLAAVVRVTGISVLGGGVGGLFGRLENIPMLYNWNVADVGMALASAICFILAGTGLFAASFLYERYR